MSDYQRTFDAITADPRYLANLDWGKPRPGHPEGTVRAHIAEIEINLDTLKPKLSDDEYWKLKLLIHTHDSFKAEAKVGVFDRRPPEPCVARPGVPGVIHRRRRSAGDGAVP